MTEKSCLDSYAAAKELTQSAHLIEAKKSLETCAGCNSSLQEKCATLSAQIDADIPSVVLAVTDEADDPLPLSDKVDVKMDGELLTSVLDGRAVIVDPGEHEFIFSAENGVSVTRRTLVRRGQRNRSISVSQSALNSKTTAARAVAEKAPRRRNAEPETVASQERQKDQLERGAGWPAYSLGGVGVLAVGSAALLNYWGRQDNSTLKSTCGTDCNPESVHHIRMLYLASDAAIGVGIVALATSTWLFLSPHGTEEKASTRVAHVSSVDVQPTPAGALATVRGTF